MPLKDKEKRNEASKARMQKMREGVTKQGVTDEGVTMVPASYVMGLNGKMYEALPERERYLKLSDGQVLDRLNQPEANASGDFMLRMQRCNESSYNYRPSKQRR